MDSWIIINIIRSNRVPLGIYNVIVDLHIPCHTILFNLPCFCHLGNICSIPLLKGKTVIARRTIV